MCDLGTKYILDGRTTIPVDLMTWARWFETADRRVAWDEVTNGVTVSTVFLGTDHNFRGDGEPQIFETMVFGGEHDGYCERCGTWDGAEAMHLEAIRTVSAQKQPQPTETNVNESATDGA